MATTTETSATTNVELLTINTIRTLSMDAVQKANSGHPGTPMALAPVAYSLWHDILRYDPENPDWPNRDRFVLSCGHACMLLYSVLHLAGVQQLDHEGNPTGELAVTLDQIKQFRQLHSRTPGHPEMMDTTGVETTTGPLGQGCGNSVGMAIASKWLAAHFNRPGYDLFDFNVYTFCSDGDLMEGVSNEAASLAGHLKLNNLCWIYDNNHITIEGETNLAYSDDVPVRFKGLGWNVIKCDDANDTEALTKAYKKFLRTKDKPTIIIVRSHIGYGAPHKQDTSKAHGEPLGADEIRAAKESYGWPPDEQFLVPEEARQHFQEGVAVRGRKLHKKWQSMFRKYAKEFPDLAHQWNLMDRRDLPEDWDAEIAHVPRRRQRHGQPSFRRQGAQCRGRTSALADRRLGRPGPFHHDAANVRGLHQLFARRLARPQFPFRHPRTRHGGGAQRHGHLQSAAVRSHVLHVLRLLQALVPLQRHRPPAGDLYFHARFDRPGRRWPDASIDRTPGRHARRAADRSPFAPPTPTKPAKPGGTLMPIKDRPVALVLTRQALPTLDRNKYASATGLAKGAYVLIDSLAMKPQVILIGTGSEVSICIAAHEQLTQQGIASRVVSMPSWELFEMQDEAYRNSVLPPDMKARVACEAGVRQGWDRYIGPTAASSA